MQRATEDRAIGVAADEIRARRRLIRNTFGEDRIARQGIAGAAVAHFRAQAAQQYVIRRLVLGVQLEARALEPLHAVILALDRLGLRIAQRQAKQRQALGLALALLAVELQAAGAPGRQDRAADMMASFGEESAVGLRFGLGESNPVAALLGQPVDAKPPEQDIIGPRVFGVQLQPYSLEPLRLNGLAFQRLLLLRRHWEPEDSEP